MQLYAMLLMSKIIWALKNRIKFQMNQWILQSTAIKSTQDRDKFK